MTFSFILICISNQPGLACPSSSVVCGSRFPDRRDLAKYDDALTVVRVTSIDTALNQAGLVVLALPADAIVPTLTPFREGTVGKILVDVSNPDEKVLEGIYMLIDIPPHVITDLSDRIEMTPAMAYTTGTKDVFANKIKRQYLIYEVSLISPS